MNQQIEPAVCDKYTLSAEDVIVRSFWPTAQTDSSLQLTKLRAGGYTDCYGPDRDAVLQCCHDNGKKDVFKAEGSAYINGYQYYCDGMGLTMALAIGIEQ